MTQIPLKQFLEGKVSEKIAEAKQLSRQQYEKSKIALENFDIDNGTWKIILNKSTPYRISEISSGKLPTLISKLEDKHYSVKHELPTYIVQARLAEKNIDIPDSYWIEFIRDKAGYISKYYTKK